MKHEVEVFNPHNKPVEELPVIYGFPNGRFGHDDLCGQLLAEDGTPLGGHVCSNEYFMVGDLGVSKGSRPDRHEGFRKHYPDGYRMEFVEGAQVKTHPGLEAACQRNREAAKNMPQDDALPAEATA